MKEDYTTALARICNPCVALAKSLFLYSFLLATHPYEIKMDFMGQADSENGASHRRGCLITASFFLFYAAILSKIFSFKGKLLTF